jgi:hypothetical protein
MVSRARILLNEARGFVAESWWHRMIRYTGNLRSTRRVPERLKSAFAQRAAFQDRTEVQLAVAGHYSGGDYFEFGSAGFNSLRSFLSAFDLNGHSTGLPDVRFFAFDLFGELDSGSGVPPDQAWYFEVYRGAKKFPDEELQRHGILLDRVEMIKGYFSDTLNADFKARLRREGRKIGYAFIDVNIAPSYATVFDFLPEFMQEGRCFVYMDEYFLVPEVPILFQGFCKQMADINGMAPYYIRNAGSFGALFCFMTDSRPAR